MRTRDQKIIALLLTLALLALAYTYVLWRKQTSTVSTPTLQTQVPKRLVDFALPDTTGKMRRLSDWQGKLLIVNFWATWCPPCRAEIPLFVQMQKKYGPQGLMIIGVAVDKKQAVDQFLSTRPINYPSMIGDSEAMQIMARYGNTNGSLPFSIIILKDGRVLARKLGPYDHIELESLLAALLPSS